MKLFLLWASLFFLTRIPFINYGQVFFDSGEYIERLSNPNFFQALTMGHVPLHVGYILVNWPVWQIVMKLGGTPGFFVILLQIFISFLGMWGFYKVCSEIISQRVALFAVLIVSLGPLYWITNTTVMMESVYVSFFFVSMWIFTLFLKNREIYLLILGSLFLFISFLTHLAPLLYMPFFVLVLWVVSKKYQTPSPHKVAIVAIILVTFLGFSFINSFLLDQNSLSNGLEILYLGKTQEASPFEASLEGIGRYVRNWFVPMAKNSTTLVFLISIIAFWKLYKKRDFTILAITALLILPSLLVNQWADSLWYGRHALISVFGVALLVSYILHKSTKKVIGILLYMLLITLPQIFLLRDKIPYLELQEFVRTLDEDDFYIESHYARPQIETVRKENTYFVNEPRNQGDLNTRIKESLEKNRNVYISSQALSEPYGLYSGPYLHLLSLSYRNEPTLESALDGNFKLVETDVINKGDNIIVYEIIPTDNNFIYPRQIRLTDSRRRIDNSDPLMKIYSFLKNRI